VNKKFDTSLEIKQRNLSAQRAFYGVSHILSSKSITRNTKITIYNTLICLVTVPKLETQRKQKTYENVRLAAKGSALVYHSVMTNHEFSIKISMKSNTFAETSAHRYRIVDTEER
jgi:hypothetical protein